jgi:sugar O-acyltransferase (sialic acid O-acetyltransferase NeuD family)
MPDVIETSPLNVVVIGASGHARVVAEAAELSHHAVAGYLAPEPLAEADQLLHEYLGNDDKLPDLIGQGFQFCIGLGFVNAAGAARRRQLLDRLPQDRLPVIRHPSSIVSRYSNCGAGAMIAAGATVGTRAVIGAGAIINTGSIVDHDSTVGENTHVAIGAKIAGGVRIGENCLIGAGAVVLQGMVIGNNAVVGAGAIALRNVPDGATVFGNPARILRISQV